MRILQISDIHFVESTVDDKRYAQVESDFIKDISAQHSERYFDYVLICGDIAFSGKKEEYTRASVFIDRICRAIQCSKDNILVVPGNHDLERDINADLKEYISKFIAANPDGFIDSCRKSDELRSILRSLYRPFEHFYEFAKQYKCVSAFEDAILTDGEFGALAANTCFSWSRELNEKGKPFIRVVGVNTALLSGCSKSKHKMILPSAMWMSYKKDRNHLNVLMGHHPMQDISRNEEILGQIDSRFQLQLSGHRHIQASAERQLSLRITSAAFEPEYTHSERDKKKYYPVYNIIDIDKQGDMYVIKDTPIVWKWADPGFKEEEAISFVTTAENPTSVQKRHEKNKAIKVEKHDEERSIIMLRNMDYENRRQVVRNTLPDQPISGATKNVEIIVLTAAKTKRMNKLVVNTERSFARSQYDIYNKKRRKRVK